MTIESIAAEALALGQRHKPDSDSTPRDYLVCIDDVTEEARMFDDASDRAEVRARLLMVAAIALAAVETIDANADGYPWD